MWAICKKELRQYFSSLTGYIAICVFLLVMGLVLFVFKNNILENGCSTLDDFFSFARLGMIFLMSAITMRSFSEEFRSGTFEILKTTPLTNLENRLREICREFIRCNYCLTSSHYLLFQCQLSCFR